ncbi:hypothetical protein SAMN05421594_2447 [Chryseobacterium oleae]|uniref:Uncharacterized protein n=1 Tax=Chryseobacterium oleae TaxID=491207 RepID=A0A1I4YIP6_CHROL|nr:hypothetical protein SAMN05421594_2447 [Chryseobacterium oleae]
MIKKRAAAVLPLTRSLSFPYNYYLGILFGEELLFTMESMIRQFCCNQKNLLSLVQENRPLNPGQKIYNNRTQIIKKYFDKELYTWYRAPFKF